ncbi:MAG: PEP-CTERM sorting domain-containing protein [Planctomycetaceae bacterium]
MFHKTCLYVTTLMIWLVFISRPATADVIFSYVGNPFDFVFPPVDAGPEFTTADFIFGTVTFDSIGSTSASGFTLSTTVGGAPGFTFDVPDVNNPGALTLFANSFDWGGNQTPQTFDLTIEGDVFGSASGIEQLSISSIAGDFASLDFGVGTQSDAFNFTAGTFTSTSTAVPEPSSLVLLGTVFAVAGFRTCRRRQDSSTASPRSI